MSTRSVSISEASTPYDSERDTLRKGWLLYPFVELIRRVTSGVHRRWLRERRRRQVGRAYDMALEIARVIPRGSQVLDVGCGNGFIAHHLSALLATNVVGIDLGQRTDAPIDYRRFDGTRFPVRVESFDAVLFCYVLHHAQNLDAIMSELRRVLRNGGLVIVYEDIPCYWLDRVVCWIHNRRWRRRTGPCTFRLVAEWKALFKAAGLQIVAERQLSRWRNLTHPVSRGRYVLKLNSTAEDFARKRVALSLTDRRCLHSQKYRSTRS